MTLIEGMESIHEVSEWLFVSVLFFGSFFWPSTISPEKVLTNKLSSEDPFIAFYNE